MYTATFLKVTRFFRSIICQKTNHEEGTTALKESVCVVVQRVKYYDKKTSFFL